jgi:hypothetical protein
MNKIIENKDSQRIIESQMGNQVWDRIREQVSYELENQIWNRIYMRLSEQVWDLVYIQIYNQINDQKKQAIESILNNE